VLHRTSLLLRSGETCYATLCQKGARQTLQSVLYSRKQTLFVSYSWARNAAFKKKDSGMDEPERKSVVQRGAENQVAVRGSKYLGAELVAYGTALKNKPDYTIVVTEHAARRNRQGTVMVGAKTQRTIEPTRSMGGRDFLQTDGKTHKRRRKKVARYILLGRTMPLLGYTYMGMNYYQAYRKGGVVGVQQKHASDFDPIQVSYDIVELVRGSKKNTEYYVEEFARAQSRVNDARASMNAIGPGY
jgi:hypothetical protein